MDDQDSFDPFDDFIKREPEINTSQTIQDKYCLRKLRTFKNEDCNVRDDTTFNDFKYPKTEKFTPVEIKEEIIECEVPKMERLDLQTKIDQDTVSENVQMFSKNVKRELVNISDVKVTNIKPEVSECIQPKTESVVRELLTSECDLPTLKIENTVYYPNNYLGHTYTNKPLKNTAQVILKKKRRRYDCPICQNNFPSSKSRSTHIDGHFEKRYVICQFCGRIMKKIDFYRHFFIHKVKRRLKNHIDDKPLEYNHSSKKLRPKNINDVDDKQFKCGTCFKTFNLKFKLQRHLIIHSAEKPFKCDICSKGFSRKQTLQQHSIIHSGEKPYKCNICSKSYSQKQTLKYHLIIHSNEKSYNCDICSKYFNYKSNLLKHLIVHSGEKPFKCDICSKGFSQKSNLQLHLIIHSGKKPFKCEFCFRGFNQNNDLQRHLIIHSGNKPFKCEICSKCFNDKSNLLKHLIIHSGEKPFKCDICSKGFSQKSNLQLHLLIHTGEKPFKCDICYKCFNNKSNLQQHLVIHSGEKSFKCDICFKFFTLKSQLRQHFKIHSGDKPFKCDKRSKCFTKKPSLLRHLLIHSGEKPFK